MSDEKRGKPERVEVGLCISLNTGISGVVVGRARDDEWTIRWTMAFPSRRSRQSRQGSESPSPGRSSTRATCSF